jgi:hypothetical protein
MLRMMERGTFDTLIDLGSGDGQFALSVVRGLGRRVNLMLVDQQRVPGAPDDVIISDVMTFLRAFQRRPKTAIMANLFLHHFTDELLRDLFYEVSQKADYLFACEPRRSRLSLAALRLLPLIGCNAVSRHDAAASVRAGFLGQELTASWPRNANWKLVERESSRGSHCFMAAR